MIIYVIFVDPLPNKKIDIGRTLGFITLNLTFKCIQFLKVVLSETGKTRNFHIFYVASS